MRASLPLPAQPHREFRHGGADDPERLASEDIRVESAVLAYVVTERLQGVIIAMLALRFAAEFDQGSSGMAVERAVRELVRDGRMRMRGGRVVPNRPDCEVAR